MLLELGMHWKRRCETGLEVWVSKRAWVPFSLYNIGQTPLTIQRIVRINTKKLSQATDWATITITIYHVSTVHNGHININTSVTSTWQLKHCFHIGIIIPARLGSIPVISWFISLNKTSPLYPSTKTLVSHHAVKIEPTTGSSFVIFPKKCRVRCLKHKSRVVLAY